MWVATGCYTALAGVVLADSRGDIAFQISARADVVERDPSRFPWISFENINRELVRFVSTGTLVRESILAPEDVSGLLLAFTGRTIVQLPGTTSREPAHRHTDLIRAFYGDEGSFYELCRREKVDYVVYSIDVLLDDGPYSLQYLAGTNAIDPSSVAVRMHFEPETLTHFTLLYENDHYRLFKVTDTMQPVFLTDHPLFFQRELFARDGRDLLHFRNHVMWLMLTYANATRARLSGNGEEARKLLDTCLRQAPRFTRARLAMADTYMDAGMYEKARDEINTVIHYAPDNPSALYSAAYVQVQLGQPDAAAPYLKLLTQTGNRELIEKAKSLQYYIDHKLPLKPGAPD